MALPWFLVRCGGTGIDLGGAIGGWVVVEGVIPFWEDLGTHVRGL